MRLARGSITLPSAERITVSQQKLECDAGRWKAGVRQSRGSHCDGGHVVVIKPATGTIGYRRLTPLKPPEIFSICGTGGRSIVLCFPANRTSAAWADA